jgi:hypothetical protein
MLGQLYLGHVAANEHHVGVEVDLDEPIHSTRTTFEHRGAGNPSELRACNDFFEAKHASFLRAGHTRRNDAHVKAAKNEFVRIFVAPMRATSAAPGWFRSEAVLRLAACVQATLADKFSPSHSASTVVLEQGSHSLRRQPALARERRVPDEALPEEAYRPGLAPVGRLATTDGQRCATYLARGADWLMPGRRAVAY